ncbi:hypothetical protein HNV12_01080 [Methanococcoides sp. SA1]|nr:hypothetical protein [Methanococcoides sp. SA1]
MEKGVGIFVLCICLFGSVCALDVNLSSPVDDYVFNSTVSNFTMIFEYVVNGSFNVSYCNLSVNGSVVNSTNDSMLGNNSVSYLFEGNRSTHDSNYSYEWVIFCEDLNGTEVNSSVRSFKVNLRNVSAVAEFLIVVDIGNYTFVDFDRNDVGLDADEVVFSVMFQNWTNGSNHFAYYDKSGVNYSMIAFRQKLDDSNQSLKEALNSSFSTEVIRGSNRIRSNGAGGLFWSSGEYAVFLKDVVETPWDVVDDYLVKFVSDDVVAVVAPPAPPAGGGGGSSGGSSVSVPVQDTGGWGAPENVSVDVEDNDSELEIVEEDIEKDEIGFFSLFSGKIAASDVSKAFWIALGILALVYLRVKRKK